MVSEGRVGGPADASSTSWRHKGVLVEAVTPSRHRPARMGGGGQGEVSWSDGLEDVGGWGALEVVIVGPDPCLELAEKGSGLFHRVKLEVDRDVVRVLDTVANLDCGDAALGTEVVEGSEGFEPGLEVVDAVF